MVVTREMLIKKLAKESGYWEKDIRHVLHCLDKVVLDCFSQVTEDEEVSIQLIQGLKCGCSVVPSRERVDPRTREPIICAPTVKPNTKYSKDFKKLIQEQYDEKNDG